MSAGSLVGGGRGVTRCLGARHRVYEAERREIFACVKKRGFLFFFKRLVLCEVDAIAGALSPSSGSVSARHSSSTMSKSGPTTITVASVPDILRAHVARSATRNDEGEKKN